MKHLMSLTEALSISQVRNYMHNKNEEFMKKYDSLFGGKNIYRLYIDYNGSIVPYDKVKKVFGDISGGSIVDRIDDVNQELSKYDFMVMKEDPKFAINKRNGQKVSAFKVLNKFAKENSILQKFAELLQRFSTNQETPEAETSKGGIVCISRHPYDIAGMSTNRKWDSCMHLETGRNRGYVMADVLYESFVAYHISKEDPNINNPIGRIMLRKYDSESNKGEYIYYPIKEYSNNQYSAVFYDACLKFCDKKLNGASDKGIVFNLRCELYGDDKRQIINKNALANITEEEYADLGEDGAIEIYHNMVGSNKYVYILRDGYAMVTDDDMKGEFEFYRYFKKVNDPNLIMNPLFNDNEDVYITRFRYVLNLTDITKSTYCFYRNDDNDYIGYCDGKFYNSEVKELTNKRLIASFLVSCIYNSNNKYIMHFLTGEPLDSKWDITFLYTGSNYVSLYAYALNSETHLIYNGEVFSGKDMFKLMSTMGGKFGKTETEIILYRFASIYGRPLGYNNATVDMFGDGKCFLFTNISFIDTGVFSLQKGKIYKGKEAIDLLMSIDPKSIDSPVSLSQRYFTKYRVIMQIMFNERIDPLTFQVNVEKDYLTFDNSAYRRTFRLSDLKEIDYIPFEKRSH